MSGRSWWRRGNSVDGSAGSPESRRVPWTIAQVWMNRGGFVFVLVVGALIAAAYSNVVFGVIPVLILLRMAFRWTPHQRGQIFGWRPPQR
jgi:hypothetical protein